MPRKAKNDRREYQHRYYEEHREELRAKQRLNLQKPDIKAKRREYSKQYEATHREQKNKQMREYRHVHPHYGVAGGRNWRRKLRKRVINHFGGKCVWCGFADWRALQIDHINGGGRKAFLNDRPSPVRYHLDLLTAKPGIVYQLLCANCNQIKKYERNETTTKISPFEEIGKALKEGGRVSCESFCM